MVLPKGLKFVGFALREKMPGSDGGKFSGFETYSHLSVRSNLKHDSNRIQVKQERNPPAGFTVFSWKVHQPCSVDGDSGKTPRQLLSLSGITLASCLLLITNRGNGYCYCQLQNGDVIEPNSN